eukprot:SAG31_NODE_1530_length_7993_cov_7.079807_7_plen_49_part_00
MNVATFEVLNKFDIATSGTPIQQNLARQVRELCMSMHEKLFIHVTMNT